MDKYIKKDLQYMKKEQILISVSKGKGTKDTENKLIKNYLSA